MNIRRFTILASLAIAILTVTSAFCYGQEKAPSVSEDSIVFIEGDAPTAFNKAVQMNRYVFVDLQAKWCGPCKILKEKVFTNKRVAEYFNSHFVNLSVDVVKGAGPNLAKKWHVEGLPTLLILDAKGNIIKKWLGYLDSESLLIFAGEVMDRK